MRKILDEIPPHLPDECLAIRREGQRCDGTVVALQNTDALAGPQIPDTDPTVDRGREELQPADVWMKLNQTEKDMAFKHGITTSCASIASLQEGIIRFIEHKREMISKQFKIVSSVLTVQHQTILSDCVCSTASQHPTA